MSLILIAFPIIAGGAGYLLQSALQDAGRIIWWRIALSVSLVACLCIALAWIASAGEIAPVVAVVLAAFTTVAVLFAGIWVAWTVPGWRKLSVLPFVILAPYAFWASIQYGDAQSPEKITQQHGDLIVQTLERYHNATGAYPLALTDLVPAYIPALPEALTTQGTGWLYKAQRDQFALGFWYWPDKLGAMVCKYRTSERKWDCSPAFDAQGWAPFDGISTP